MRVRLIVNYCTYAAIHSVFHPTTGPREPKSSPWVLQNIGSKTHGTSALK